MKQSVSKSGRKPPAKTNVRLTNLFDELQVRKGKLARSRIRSLVVAAVADDEPVWSVVPKRIVSQLGLTAHRAWNGWQADGMKFKICGRTTSESTLVRGRNVMIGRTVLAGTDLVIDAGSGRVITNPKHPNGPVFRV